MIQVALFGLGNMGKNHLRVLREDPRFEVVAVIDPKIEENGKLLTSEIKKFKTYGEFNASGLKPEAAVIASHTETHFDVAQPLIERGIHLLIEKPLCETYTKCLQLKDLAEKNHARVGVGHVERFNPAVRKLKEVLECGHLGQVMHFAFTRVGGYPDEVNRGNNVVLDLAIHDLDILSYLGKSMKLTASICRSLWKPGVFDTAEILLADSEGVAASLHVNWVTPTKIRTIRVTGTLGVCFVDYMLQTCVLMGGNLLKSRKMPKSDFQTLVEEYRNSDRIEFGVRKREPLKEQLESFVAFMAGQPSEISTIQEAAQTVRLVEEATANSK